MKIEGSVALITGANGGIGRALVVELLRRGATKVYVATRSGLPLDDLPEQSQRLVPLRLDVTNSSEVEAAAFQASDVTLLINNAGYSAMQGALAEDRLDGARREVEVNYFGPLNLARAFAPKIAISGGGTILNVLSFLSLATLPLMGTYSAAKAAALAVTRSLRAELAARDIAVIAAMPVQVNTAMGSWTDGPKVTPDEAARDMLDAVEAGQSEVFPGSLSRDAAESFRADPAAVQAQLASVLPVSV